MHGKLINDRYPFGHIRPGITLPYKEGVVEYDSLGFQLNSHIFETGNHACYYCRKEMGFPVGKRMSEVKAAKAKAKVAQASTKRPPKEVHVTDVETALHNVVCQNIYNAGKTDSGYDLFENHRKAATGLIEQLKLQGIKLVPDPDFEDGPPPCKHNAIVSIRNNPALAFKDRQVTGVKCVTCKAEAKFA